MSRAALGVGAVVVSAGVVDRALVRLLERAERQLEPEDPVSIQLQSRRAIELYWQIDRLEAEAASERALAHAERSGDARALGAALHARRFVLRGPDHLSQRIQLGERLVDLASAAHDEELELLAYVWLIPEHLQAGERTAVERDLVALDDLERRVRRPLCRWYVLLFQSLKASLEGRSGDALERIDEARALGRRIGSQPADMFAFAQRAVVLRDIGRASDALAELRALAAQYPLLVTFQCELCMFLAELGETAEARELLERLAADAFRAVPRDSLWRASIAFSAQAAATLGESEHARAAAALLRPYIGLNVVQGVPSCWGAVDHFVAVAVAAAGDLDDAVVHLQNAVSLHTSWGAAAFRVASQAELANVLYRRGLAEDRMQVAGLEAAVRVEAARLGIARCLLERDRRAQSDAASGRPSWDGLTAREREILRQLAGGSSNKEIAAALRISVHTVERHLANAYAKIGVRNRAEAAAHVTALGLDG